MAAVEADDVEDGEESDDRTRAGGGDVALGMDGRGSTGASTLSGGVLDAGDGRIP